MQGPGKLLCCRRHQAPRNARTVIISGCARWINAFEWQAIKLCGNPLTFAEVARGGRLTCSRRNRVPLLHDERPLKLSPAAVRPTRQEKERSSASRGTLSATLVSHPAEGGSLGCSACASDNEEEALLQARRPVAHARSDGNHSLTPSIRLRPRTRPHHQAAPGHPPARQEGHSASRCEGPPSSSELLTRRELVPPVLCRPPLRASQKYRAVSQGNWVVNCFQARSPCGAP